MLAAACSRLQEQLDEFKRRHQLCAPPLDPNVASMLPCVVYAVHYYFILVGYYYCFYILCFLERGESREEGAFTKFLFIPFDPNIADMPPFVVIVLLLFQLFVLF